MTPRQFVVLRDAYNDIIEQTEKIIADAQELAEGCPVPENLRPATPSDIVEGNILWYPHWAPGRAWAIVDGVDRPDDEWKAYTYEGARYGWKNAFVEVRQSDPRSGSHGKPDHRANR